MKRILLISLIFIILLLGACGKTPSSESQSDNPDGVSDSSGTQSPDISDLVSPSDTADTAEPSVTPSPTETLPSPETPSLPEHSSTPEPSPEVSESPSSEPEESQSPAPSEPPLEPSDPYSELTDDTVLTVSGRALDRDYYFTLDELQKIGGYVEEDYFSRSSDPKESTDHFIGISIRYLIENVIGIADYKKASFTSADGYAVSYSKSAINASYIDETDSSKSLQMILAWSENNSPCTLRLVMGQMIEGEYNRMNWVRSVTNIDITAD